MAETNLTWASPDYLQQNMLGYDCSSDVYSLGLAGCEAANGSEKSFGEVPHTLMMLEKLRGAPPVFLIDSTDMSQKRQQEFQDQLQLALKQQQEQQQQQQQDVAFAGKTR